MCGHRVLTSKKLKEWSRKLGFSPKLAWDIVEMYSNASFSSLIIEISENIRFWENFGNIMWGHKKRILAWRRVCDCIFPIIFFLKFLSPKRVYVYESKCEEKIEFPHLFKENIPLSCGDIYAWRKTKVEIKKWWNFFY